MTKQYTIPIFVPHLGCPYDCVFCNQDRITGQSTNVNSEDVRDTIEEYLSYFDKPVWLEVGFFGGSFTGIAKNKQEELLSVAKEYKEKGLINGIRLSTRPDFINKNIIERLEFYLVDTIELGVQSLVDDVLVQSGRGHNSKTVYKAVELIDKSNIKLGLQMMMGLPGDTYENSLYTVKEFIKLNPSCVRIYPTLVIKDTQLESKYLDGKYKPLDLETAIESAVDYLIMFQIKKIDVIRLGLQATENIQLGRDVTAGPFHPSFGALVQSRIFRKILDRRIINDKLKTDLIIHANKKSISSIVGDKANNKEFLMNKYNLKNIYYLADENIKFNNMVIDYGTYKEEIDYEIEIKKYCIENID